MNKRIIKNFFVFEGIDGSGTTTQIKLLKDFLEKKHKSIFQTAEPTNFETGTFLRRCLSGEISVQAETMVMLFAADRNEHLFSEQGILRAATQYDIVLSDRYLFSSLAYQGASGYLDLAKKLNADFPLPEILFFLQVDIDTALQRIEKRAAQKEIYETKPFQQRVAEMYMQVLDLYKASGMKIITVDANETRETVHRQIRDIFTERT